LEEGLRVRDARPEELAFIGDLRMAAYQADGFISPASEYAAVLRALGADGTGDVLAAEADGEIVGTVMLQYWPTGGEVLQHPGEAEIRALAVAPGAQGRGIGRTLLTAALDRARQRDVRHLVLLTLTGMRAAQHLYTSAGFHRLPERDWVPPSGTLLLAFGKILGGNPG
jgi:ribosomal protein S18 acetylase RimI-like enzyme